MCCVTVRGRPEGRSSTAQSIHASAEAATLEVIVKHGLHGLQTPRPCFLNPKEVPKDSRCFRVLYRVAFARRICSLLHVEHPVFERLSYRRNRPEPSLFLTMWSSRDSRMYQKTPSNSEGIGLQATISVSTELVLKNDTNELTGLFSMLWRLFLPFLI